jgi:hypothetical protein
MSFEQTRFVEDLRDIYKDKEIWIIGTGKSLDDFSDDFFDDKISITLNWAILRYPSCNFWHGHHELYREYFRDEKLELLEKCIISYPFPGPFDHGRILDPVEFFGDKTSIPIWIKFHDIRPIPKSALEESVVGALGHRENVRYHASMTVAHTGILSALVMGANKITLAGCEHKIFESGGGRAKKGGIFAKYRGFPYCKDERIEEGTEWLAEILSRYNIELQRFYNIDTEFYKYGYEKILGEHVTVE